MAMECLSSSVNCGLHNKIHDTWGGSPFGYCVPATFLIMVPSPVTDYATSSYRPFNIPVIPPLLLQYSITMASLTQYLICYIC